MKSVERKAEAEPSREVGISVEVYLSLYSPVDQRILLEIDKEKARSGEFVLTPLRARLKATPSDLKTWKRYHYRQAQDDDDKIGFFPQDEVPRFIGELGRSRSTEVTAKNIFERKLLPYLSSQGRVSDANFDSFKGLFRRNRLQRSGTDRLDCSQVFHFKPSSGARDALQKAQEAGSGIVLVDAQDIKEGKAITVKYNGDDVTASFDPSCRILTECQYTYPEVAYLLYALSKHDRKLARELHKLLNESEQRGEILLPREIDWMHLQDTSISDDLIEEFIPFYRYIREFILGFGERADSNNSPHLTEGDLRRLREIGDPRLVKELEKAIMISRSMSYVFSRLLYFLGESMMLGDSLDLTQSTGTQWNRIVGAAFLVVARFLAGPISRFAKESVEMTLGRVLNDIANKHVPEDKALHMKLTALAAQASIVLGEAESIPTVFAEVAAPAGALSLAYNLYGKPERAILYPLFTYLAAYLLEKYYLYRNIIHANKDKESVEGELIRQLRGAAIRTWPLFISALVLSDWASTDAIAAGLVIGHLGDVADLKDEIDKAISVKFQLISTLDTLNTSLGSGSKLVAHKLRVMSEEKEQEVYLDEERRRFRRLDAASNELKTSGSVGVFENYYIRTGAKEIISDGTMILASGCVNALQVSSDEELSVCLAALGERLDHQGTLLLRRKRVDYNLHELPINSLIHYCNCDPAETSSQDVFSDFFTSSIASRLKEAQNGPFKVVFKREIDHAQRVDLLRQYLKSTGMFDEEEIIGWNPQGQVSGSMATRLKVAAAFLNDGMIILDDIYDERFYRSDEWERERGSLQRVSKFISEQAKGGEQIILLGVNSMHELDQDYFRGENVMGKIYTVSQQKFVYQS